METNNKKSGYVYFFKHKGIKGVKIGMTNGDSVNDRFKSFSTYSPFGCEILGFIQTDRPLYLENLLHDKYKNLRLSGEFFNIDDLTVLSIIDKFENESAKNIKKIFNEWISNPDNDIDCLKKLMKTTIIYKRKGLKDNKVLENLYFKKEELELKKLEFNLSEATELLDKKFSKRSIKLAVSKIKSNNKLHRYINYKGFSKTGRTYII